MLAKDRDPVGGRTTKWFAAMPAALIVFTCGDFSGNQPAGCAVGRPEVI